MDKYAVFGNPIQHSKSPQIHSMFAQQTEQALEYTAIQAELNDFSGAIAKFIAQGGKGCNVTVPFKEQAFKIADQVSERAKLAQAVNTFVFNDDGTIIADNTDGAGLVEDLKANKAPLTGTVLLIGAGGAARGVIKPLLDSGVSSLVICNRTHEKAIELAKHFAPYGKVEALAIEQLDNMVFDLVINSTSASLTDELPPVPASIFSTKTFAYDMVYKNQLTSFCQWALKNNCLTAVDGLGMLVGQAAVAFELWRGVMPETINVLAQLRNGSE